MSEKSKGLLLFSKFTGFLELLSLNVTEVLSHGPGGQHLKLGCLQGGVPLRAMEKNPLWATSIALGVYG